MKYVFSTLGACLLLGAAPLAATAQDQESQPNSSQPNPSGFQTMQSITGKATVQNIDYKDRVVTLKGQNGQVRTFQVGEQVRNLDQVKKGDQVTFHYQESLALAVHKSDQPPSASEQEMLMRAEPGQLPGGAAIQTTQITATVENLDRETREITLRLPQGQTKTLKVPKSNEAFDRLQKGDQVAATFTDAVSIEVTKPGQ